jgi:hypothetical protein
MEIQRGGWIPVQELQIAEKKLTSFSTRGLTALQA